MSFVLKIIFILSLILSLLFIVLGFYASDGLFFVITILFIIAAVLIGLEIRKKNSNPFE